MDSIGKDCNLLYKKELNQWLKEQEKNAEFQKKELNLLTFLRSSIDEEHRMGLPVVINYCMGWIYYTVPELELFKFTEPDGSVTIFKLLLDESNLDFLSDEAGQSTSSKRELYNDYPVSLCGLTDGSLSGTKFLGFSDNGHLLLLDWATKSGTLIGKWPIPSSVHRGCFGLMAYEPNISGAISNDGSLVAVIGPVFDDIGNGNDDDGGSNDGSDDVDGDYNGDDNDVGGKDGGIVGSDAGGANNDGTDNVCDNDKSFNSTIDMRLFDVTKHQCDIKQISIASSVEVTNSDILMMAFNPYQKNILYIMFNSYDMYYNHSSDDDDEDSETDKSNSWLLAVYDTELDTITATRQNIILLPHMSDMSGDGFINGAVFIHHGNMLITYQILGSKCEHILLIDAFTLITIATVKLSVSIIPLKYQFLVSTCEAEIAVFKKDGDADIAEVYKIPDYDISLMNICRKKITQCVDQSEIEKLSMLPKMLRNYLKF